MRVVQEQDGGKISILFEHGTNWDSNRRFPHFMVAGLLHMFICYVLSVVISQTKPHVFFFRLLRTGVNKVGAGKTGFRGRDLEEDGTGLFVHWIGNGNDRQMTR
jgi:hypothetical protein